MSVRGVVGYGSAAVFWAAFFILYTLAVQSLGVVLASGLFGVFAGLFLLGLAKIVGREINQPPKWNAVLMWAGLGWVIFGATALAMRTVGAAETAILISSLPLFSTVSAQMRGDSRVTGIGAISLFLGITGLVLVALFPVGDASLALMLGAVAGLTAAITAGWCGRPLANRLHEPQSVQTVALTAILGGLGLLVVVPFVELPVVGFPMVTTIVILALCCAFLALFVLSSASDDVPRRIAATLPGIGTVMAVLGGVVFLHEALSVVQLFGMALILASTAMLRGLVPRWFPASWQA
ncbi:MAG TPA: DMT family transporter [Propionicimonas sp.]|jgi:drug/metabolite transporter (DMT)-like permease|nr:DMT family transporter [Propionicimonas sp.]